MLAGSKGGTVYRVSATGTVSAVRAGFHQVRGVAYDPTGHRLFIADHGTGGAQHAVYVLPQN